MRHSTQVCVDVSQIGLIPPHSTFVRQPLAHSFVVGSQYLPSPQVFDPAKHSTHRPVPTSQYDPVGSLAQSTSILHGPVPPIPPPPLDDEAAPAMPPAPPSPPPCPPTPLPLCEPNGFLDAVASQPNTNAPVRPKPTKIYDRTATSFEDEPVITGRTSLSPKTAPRAPTEPLYINDAHVSPHAQHIITRHNRSIYRHGFLNPIHMVASDKPTPNVSICTAMSYSCSAGI